MRQRNIFAAKFLKLKPMEIGFSIGSIIWQEN